MLGFQVQWLIIIAFGRVKWEETVKNMRSAWATEGVICQPGTQFFNFKFPISN